MQAIAMFFGFQVLTYVLFGTFNVNHQLHFFHWRRLHASWVVIADTVAMVAKGCLKSRRIPFFAEGVIAH